MKKKIFFKNLDGLRFLCFLSIFLFHSFHTEFSEIKATSVYQFIKRGVFGNGNIGVNFFFVLSGFLITYLLIEEKKLNGQINLKNFWIRRILRIWPLFYLCVFIGFIVFPWIKDAMGQISNETANPIYYLTFLNNFDFIKNGLPDSSILGVLWSIAIEEQFYLIWPVILYICPLDKLWLPFGIIIISSLTFRAFNDHYLIHEYHTLSCIGDMTIGATGAWLISVSQKFKNKIENLSRFQIAAIYVVFIFIFFFRDEVMLSNYGMRIFERTIIAFVILLIILEQTFSTNSLFKMARFKKISKLGIITYGLYSLHAVCILVIVTLTKKLGINTHLWEIIVVETPLAFCLTIVVSKISYTYFEGPFLKLKNKFAYITKE